MIGAVKFGSVREWLRNITNPFFNKDLVITNSNGILHSFNVRNCGLV